VAIGAVYRPFLELAREHGVDIDAVLAELQLSYHALVDQNTRLTPDQGRALAIALRRALPATSHLEALGLRAAERFVAADADLLGYIMSHSASPLDAAHALQRHMRLLGDSADYRVDIEADRVELSFGLLGGRQMVPDGPEFVVAAFFRLLRDGSRGRTCPVEVRLPRQPPRRPEVYRRFFGAPVSFGAEVGALVYEHASMLVPFQEHDLRLVRILTQHAEALLAQLPPTDSLRERVRALIVEGLVHGQLGLHHVAWRCGLGERTLRRRLEESGTSYRALVDEVRKERALALLEHDSNVAWVAQSLGFSDSTAFARAFRRWTGSLPHEHVRRTAQPEVVRASR
jgi:AraC-like DNA-binding protein